MRNRWYGLPTLLLTLLLLHGTDAAAQTGQTGIVQGRVTDAAGQPVVGAALRIAQGDGSQVALDRTTTEFTNRLDAQAIDLLPAPRVATSC